MKIVIIGGVAGGASAATRLKRLDEHAEVILFERGNYISFANCGLPYHISGIIPEKESLIVMNPEKLKNRSNIDIRINTEILSIDKDKKTVKAINYQNNQEYTESYDKLIISTGSSPIVPNIEGIVDPSIHVLWSIPDMDKIIKGLGNTSKTVAVVGGGFIGLELIENLKLSGHYIHLIERNSQVMTSLDPEMAVYLQDILQEEKIECHFNSGVEKFSRQNDEQLLVHLQGGKSIAVDQVILAIGIQPNSKLATDIRLKTNQRGGIVVNEFLQTSDKDIYAIGDVIETVNLSTSQRAMIPLAGPANRQGRIVAQNVLGDEVVYQGVLPVSICKIFEFSVASAGLNENQLKELKYDYKKVYVHANSHPTYYPNSTIMHIKLLFNNKGEIYGAQIVGQEGVDKRIDIFAVAIKNKISVFNLAEQDLAYAPPYSSPRDPIHVASFAAINMLTGLSELIYKEDIQNDDIILDVRENNEVAKNPVKEALHIPLGQVRTQLDQLNKDKRIVVMCEWGLRGYLAERILRQNGFNVVNFSGGYLSYKNGK